MTYSKCVDRIRNALCDMSALAEKDKFSDLNKMIWQAHKLVDVFRILLRTHGRK